VVVAGCEGLRLMPAGKIWDFLMLVVGSYEAGVVVVVVMVVGLFGVVMVG